MMYISMFCSSLNACSKNKPCVVLLVTIWLLDPMPKMHFPTLRYFWKKTLAKWHFRRNKYCSLKWCCFITKEKRHFQLAEKEVPEIFLTIGSIYSCKYVFMSSLIFSRLGRFFPWLKDLDSVKFSTHVWCSLKNLRTWGGGNLRDFQFHNGRHQ